MILIKILCHSGQTESGSCCCARRLTRESPLHYMEQNLHELNLCLPSISCQWQCRDKVLPPLQDQHQDQHQDQLTAANKLANKHSLKTFNKLNKLCGEETNSPQFVLTSKTLLPLSMWNSYTPPPPINSELDWTSTLRSNQIIWDCQRFTPLIPIIRNQGHWKAISGTNIHLL